MSEGRITELYAEIKSMLKEQERTGWGLAERIWRLHHECHESQRAIGQEIGRHRRSVGRYIEIWERWRASAPRPEFADAYAEVNGNTVGDLNEITARKALSEPGQRQRVIASLPSEQIEQVIQEANAVAIERMQAKRAEHDAAQKDPTARDLMGNDPFDPSESWADTHLIRVQDKAHALRRQVEKWGLVLGSLSEEEAFGMLQEAERNVAEVRVVLQERMADRSRAEA